jgi:hypothetical protein
MRAFFPLIAVALSPWVSPAIGGADPDTTPGSAVATTSNPAPAKPPLFKAAMMGDLVPGVNLEVRYGVLTCGTNRLTFVIPEKLGMQSDSVKQQVEMRAQDGGCIAVRVLSGDDARLLDLKAQELQDKVAGRYTRGKIVGESRIAIENRSGPAFDVRWIAGGGIEMFSRIGYIPLGSELLEFNLTCAAGSLPPYLPIMSELALSFRVGPVGGPLKLREFLTDF